MSEENLWYRIENTSAIDTPALVIYQDRMEENIRLLIRSIDDKERLRPHVKTHKSGEVTKLIMKAGITKFKCATIAEAEMLGICGAKDVLLAYQPNGPKLNRFVSLIKTFPGTSFACLVDDPDSARSIADVAVSNGLVIAVYIDLNVGMNRTGIAPDDSAVDLYQYCDSLMGIMPVGLHVYDGHIRAVDMEERKEICEASYEPVGEMAERLVQKGLVSPKLVMGGSPTFPIYAAKKEVECGPGTFVFWDKGYMDTLPEQPFLPAALVMGRVISLPGKDKICLDIGYKSVASESFMDTRIYFVNAPDLKITGQSEEHLVLQTGEGHSWKIGDVFYGIPLHICPTVALYEKAHVIENGRYSKDWDIMARDRGISI